MAGFPRTQWRDYFKHLGRFRQSRVESKRRRGEARRASRHSSSSKKMANKRPPATPCALCVRGAFGVMQTLSWALKTQLPPRLRHGPGGKKQSCSPRRFLLGHSLGTPPDCVCAGVGETPHALGHSTSHSKLPTHAELLILHRAMAPKKQQAALAASAWLADFCGGFCGSGAGNGVGGGLQTQR